MKRFKYVILSLPLVAVLILNACRGVTLDPVPVCPVYRIAAEWPDMDAARRDSILAADHGVLDAFMQVVRHCNAGDSAMSAWAGSDVVKVFTPEVMKVFPNVDKVGDHLSRILALAAEAGIDLPQRGYGAVVWGRPESSVFTDTVMLVALNHYLGADFPGYNAWPEYRRREKTPERLPYDLAEALVATSYPYHDTTSSTLLSRILYDGAMTLVKIRIAPDGSLAGALGVDTKTLQWLHEHRTEMWNALVGKKLLYSTSAEVKDRLTSPAPATPLLHPDAPGRAGCYLGYCIVAEYMQHFPRTPLDSLLTPGFYDNPAVLDNI